MSDQGLKVVISADISDAIKNLDNFNDKLDVSGLTLDKAVDKLDSFQRAINNTTNPALINAYSDSIKDLDAHIQQLQKDANNGAIAGINNEIKNTEAVISNLAPATTTASRGLNSLNLSSGQSKIAFLDLGRVLTGQGFNLRSLAANFSLLGPEIVIAAAAIYGLVKLFAQQTDAEKKASEQAKQLQQELLNLKQASDITSDAGAGEAGNIARVQQLAAAVKDANLPYIERQNALKELQKTNKAYFGDLTLEANSLRILTDRVNSYSQALINEAVIKGQVDEIAKVSKEYTEQAKILDTLRSAKIRADKASANVQGQTNLGSGGIGSTGGDNISQQATLQANVNITTNAFLKQRDAVDKLGGKLAEYKDELNKAISEQIKFTPLNDKPAKVHLETLQQVEKEIVEINKQLDAADKRPLFKREADSIDPDQIKLLQTQISDAYSKGAIAASRNPELASAYDQLASLLQSKLNKLKNPNLTASLNLTPLVSIDQFSKIESKIEKAILPKGFIEFKVPVHLRENIEETTPFTEDDIRKIEDGLKKDPLKAQIFVNAIPSVKLAIGKDLINKADQKKLHDTIANTVTGVVASGFGDVGIALGDLLSGAANPLQKAIQSFTSILGDGLIKIGEQMILASSLIQGLKIALASLFNNPAGGVIAGIAAIALGEVIKNVGAHAFATGGIVTGPTLGLVGEAGPEVIFPLSKLNQFVQGIQGGNNNSSLQGEFRLSGSDLVLAYKRASNQYGSSLRNGA